MKRTLPHAFHVLGPNSTAYSSARIFNPSIYLRLNPPCASLFYSFFIHRLLGRILHYLRAWGETGIFIIHYLLWFHMFIDIFLTFDDAVRGVTLKSIWENHLHPSQCQYRHTASVVCVGWCYVPNAAGTRRVRTNLLSFGILVVLDRTSFRIRLGPHPYWSRSNLILFGTHALTLAEFMSLRHILILGHLFI